MTHAPDKNGQIRDLARQGKTFRDIASEAGVSIGHVKNIVTDGTDSGLAPGEIPGKWKDGQWHYGD